MPIGIYISVPFCRSKCSFCNFASGVFSRQKMSGYVARLGQEITNAEALAINLGAEFDRSVDSIYLGGGTPTTLDPAQLKQIFRTLHDEFDVHKDAEVTVECAPGTARPEILEALLSVGTNRVSLGTQSFVDQEIRSVGRLHTAEQARNDIARLRESGITNINVDLIAGLPHQTSESWRLSLEELARLQTPHASVYILEIDENSRLGRELIAGGSRYHAHQVPDSDLAADLYLEAIEFLDREGLMQYEISNFSCRGKESRHNLKYWTRQPYLGFGVDAHSMLPAADSSSNFESMRFSNTDELDTYITGSVLPSVERVNRQQAMEESMFLGLRLNSGIDLSSIEAETVNGLAPELQELKAQGLLESRGDCLRLTARGRLLSNEVFERFIAVERTA
jgi:oxygen-independent coproporphyrinogen-3 oxidase